MTTKKQKGKNMVENKKYPFVMIEIATDTDKGSETYKEKYVHIQYANLMTISKSLDLDLSNIPDHLKSYKEVSEFGAIAKTLTELLIDSNAPTLIDFLSLHQFPRHNLQIPL